MSFSKCTAAEKLLREFRAAAGMPFGGDSTKLGINGSGDYCSRALAFRGTAPGLGAPQLRIAEYESAPGSGVLCESLHES